MTVILAILVMAFALGLARSAWMLAHAAQPVRAPLAVAMAILVRLAILAAVAWLVASLHRARRWSRWVGLVLIVAMAGYNMLGTDTTHYDNAAQQAGGQIARYGLLPILCAWWAYAFALSAKARRYFARRPSDPA